jgi:hypothetical protein
MKDAMRQSRKIRHSQDDEHQTYEGLRSVVEGGAAASIQTSASVRKILTGLQNFPQSNFKLRPTRFGCGVATPARSISLRATIEEIQQQQIREVVRSPPGALPRQTNGCGRLAALGRR